MTMGVQTVLHMNEGNGDFSYARNSIMQASEVTKEVILDLYSITLPERLNIVDLGCSSGPNAVQQIHDIMDFVGQKHRQLGRTSPEFDCFLNDLPGNDFNTVFKGLPHSMRSSRWRRGAISVRVSSQACLALSMKGFSQETAYILLYPLLVFIGSLSGEEKGSCIYRLMGVVEHSGTMRGGHYVAYVRGDRIKKKGETVSVISTWFYASDSHVREVSLAEVLKAEAYILFFEKIHN